MARGQKGAEIHEVAINVLGYPAKDGGWIAHALEMDIVGHGSSFQEAFADLQELVEMQISFAVFQGSPEMIWKPAEPIWFSLFAQIRADFYRVTKTTEEETYQIAGMQIPPPHVIARMRPDSQSADGEAALPSRHKR
jgi:predicted RNase H-like HicB family nuclease